MMITTFRSFLMFAVIGLGSLPIFAQALSADLYIGTWKGEMTLGGRAMTLEFVFEPGGVHPKGFAVDPSGRRVALAQVLAFASGVVFRLERGEGSFMVFASKLSADKASVSGDVTIMQGTIERGKALWNAKKVVAAQFVPPSTPGGPTAVEAADARGRNLFAKKDYDGAIKAYSECLTLRPTHAYCRAGRAISFQRAGKYNEAIADFDVSIKANPKPPAQVYLYRADAKIGLEDYDGAVADADLAFAVNGTPDAYLTRGTAYLQAGGAMYFMAIARGKEAEVKPKGVALSTKGLVEFNKFIQLKPQDHRGYFNRGVYYFQMWNLFSDGTRLADSLADLNKAISLSPVNADIYFSRYSTNVALGNKAAAAADIAKYNELSKK